MYKDIGVSGYRGIDVSGYPGIWVSVVVAAGMTWSRPSYRRGLDEEHAVYEGRSLESRRVIT